MTTKTCTLWVESKIKMAEPCEGEIWTLKGDHPADDREWCSKCGAVYSLDSKEL